MRSNKANRGFTLVELLLVVSLAAAAFGAMSASLMTGFNVYRRLHDVTMNEEPALLFEKISSDMRNSCDYSIIAFSLNDDSVTMATMLKESVASGLAALRPVQVSYSWDADKKTVTRVETDPAFSQIPERVQVLAKNVAAFKLSYPESGHVSVYLTLENNGKMREFIKKIYMPSRYAVSV